MKYKIKEVLYLSKQLNLKLKNAVDVYNDTNSTNNYKDTIENLTAEKRILAEENEKLKSLINTYKTKFQELEEEYLSLKKEIKQ